MTVLSHIGRFGWYMLVLGLLLAFVAFRLAVSLQKYDEAVGMSIEHQANCAQLEAELDRNDDQAVQAYDAECYGIYSKALEKAISTFKGRVVTYRAVAFGIAGLLVVSWVVRRFSLRRPVE